MHFTNSALIASAYLALHAQARPRPQVSYSVVNVDGSVSGQSSTAVPTTVYQTITEASAPQQTEETTVSVTVFETPSETTAASSSPSTITIVSSAVSISTTSIYETVVSATTLPGQGGGVYTVQVASPPRPNATSKFFPSGALSSSSSTTSSSSASTSVSLSSSSSVVPSLPSTLSTITRTPILAPTTAQPTTVTIVSVSTETEAPAQTASSTTYYDNGMWHTTYPVHKPSSTPPAGFNHTLSGVHHHTTAPTASGSLAARGAAAPTGYSVVNWNETIYQ